jgi:hypothetical protein
MSDDKQDNELAWKTRIHYDDMIDRGFTPGQTTIMTIMISISQYIAERGVGSGISLITACLNAIMSGDEIDITKIKGYQDTFEEDLDVHFEPDGDWLDDDEESETDNVIHIDFNDKD